MIRPARWALGVAAGVAFAAIGSPALARPGGPVPAREVAVAGLLEAGATVTFDVRLPKEADELEFYLSLDGGRSWPVRLAAVAGPGGVSVVLPRLASPNAVLKLRVGGEEEGEEFERDLAESSPFELRVPEPSDGLPATVLKADRGSPARVGGRAAVEWSIEPGLAPASLPEPLDGATGLPPVLLGGSAREGSALLPQARPRALLPAEAADGPPGSGARVSQPPVPGRAPGAIRLPSPAPLRN